jgi:hypothetical protein
VTDSAAPLPLYHWRFGTYINAAAEIPLTASYMPTAHLMMIATAQLNDECPDPAIS